MPSNTLNNHQLLSVYRKMAEIRAFEERLHSENLTGDIAGFIHLYAGQEAIAVGVCEHLGKSDFIGSTHRGHGHCIAKECDINLMMCEIFGKGNGLCAGKGGSMHIADLSRGMLGANAIVGGAPSLAIGAALTCKHQGANNIAVSFTGDGGSNQGTTFEAMNMAVVLNLPVIFVFENNGFGEATAHDYAVGSRDIAARAGGFGLPAVRVDGADFFAVHEAAGKAVERARSGEGPSVIEAVAQRWYGHYEGEAATYFATGEIDALRKNKDPLKLFRKRVEATIDVDEFKRIDDEVAVLIDEAVKLARSSDLPGVDTLLTDVYVSY